MHALHCIGSHGHLDTRFGLIGKDLHRLDRHAGWQAVRLQLERPLVAATRHRQLDVLRIAGHQGHYAEGVDLKGPILDLQRHVDAQLTAE